MRVELDPLEVALVRLSALEAAITDRNWKDVELRYYSVLRAARKAQKKPTPGEMCASFDHVYVGDEVPEWPKDRCARCGQKVGNDAK